MNPSFWARAASGRAASEPGTRPWFEGFFSDDYLRTVRAPTPAQVARECDFIESALGLGPRVRLLDVGCGLGLHAVELASRGVSVTGVDLSLPMLSRAADEAQDRGQRVELIHSDMRDLTFDAEYDAVLCWGTTFGYFPDDANARALRRMRNALRPGGQLLLDVVNRDHVVRFQPNTVWFEGEGCICMEETQMNFRTARLEVRRNVILDGDRQRDARYSVRLYALHELGRLLQQCGLMVVEVSGEIATRGAFFGAASARLIVTAERSS